MTNTDSGSATAGKAAQLLVAKGLGYLVPTAKQKKNLVVAFAKQDMIVYGKAFDVRALSLFWYKPGFAFSATHNVYIIGLSVAEDDFFIRSFFLDTLPFIDSFTDVAGRKIFIVNHSIQPFQGSFLRIL